MSTDITDSFDCDIDKAGHPNLDSEGYRLTSPETSDYNCIAWAAGDQSQVWWPIRPPFAYWPAGVRFGEDVGAFIDVFATLGYHPCATTDLELGFEKIVLYGREGVVKHAARQLPDGWWASKLGKGCDIEHPLQGLKETKYGDVLAVLGRPSP